MKAHAPRDTKPSETNKRKTHPESPGLGFQPNEANYSPDHILYLQRTIGNAQTQRLIKDAVQRADYSDPTLEVETGFYSDSTGNVETGFYADSTQAAQTGLYSDPNAETGLYSDPNAETQSIGYSDSLAASQSIGYSEGVLEANADGGAQQNGIAQPQNGVVPPQNAAPPNPVVVAPQPPTEAPAASTNPNQAKAAKYFNRAMTLNNNGDQSGAGVLFTRAFEFDAKALYARWAATCFHASGDDQRATTWYRNYLGKSGDGSTDATVGDQVANQYLGSRGLAVAPKYAQLVSPSEEYTKPTQNRLSNREISDKAEQRRVKESGKALEEVAPLISAAHRVDKPLTDFLASAKPIADIKKSLLAALGTAFNIDQLLIECVLSQKVAAAGWTLEMAKNWLSVSGINADFSAVDPNNIQTPLLDQVSSFTVDYLKTSASRDPFQLSDDGGLLKQPGSPVTGFDTANESTAFSGQGYAIYVMTGDGEIYAASHKVGKFHHSSLIGGDQAAGAGELKITAGKLMEITNKTGHFKTKVVHLVQVLKQMISMNQNPPVVKVMGQTIASDDTSFKLMQWVGDGQAFVNEYDGSPVQFKSKWDALGFKNDPYA